MAKVYIGIPTLGADVSGLTVSNITVATASKHLVRLQLQGLSLLARNFNSLFAAAWTKGADYFVMMHADIGVKCTNPNSASWLDTLIDRMESTKAAVVSSVVAIKNYQGHTSTALQLEKNNSFRLRRLCVKECQKLPPLISRDDLCQLWNVDPVAAGPMLVNTGLMAMNLRAFPWAHDRWTGFEIRDYLAWSLDGVPETYTLPEDWHLSQWMWKKGWPYYATTELEIAHLGAQTFETPGTWGDEEDLEGPTWNAIRHWENSHQLGRKVGLVPL